MTRSMYYTIKGRSNYTLHWIAVQLYRPLSVVDRFFTERLPSNNVAFDSDVHIAGVECPTLILHARDDPIVPVCLTKKVCPLYYIYRIRIWIAFHRCAVCWFNWKWWCALIVFYFLMISSCKQLYEAGLKSRPSKWSPLQIIEFHEDLKCAHEYICRVPQLPSIIQ